MKKLLFYCCLSIFVLLSLLCVSEDEEKFKDYFPLKEGYEWKYESEYPIPFMQPDEMNWLVLNQSVYKGVDVWNVLVTCKDEVDTMRIYKAEKFVQIYDVNSLFSFFPFPCELESLVTDEVRAFLKLIFPVTIIRYPLKKGSSWDAGYFEVPDTLTQNFNFKAFLIRAVVDSVGEKDYSFGRQVDVYSVSLEFLGIPVEGSGVDTVLAMVKKFIFAPFVGIVEMNSEFDIEKIGFSFPVDIQQKTVLKSFDFKRTLVLF